MEPLQPIALQLGPISVRWYAVCILFGAFVALFAAQKEGKKFGLNSEFFLDLFMYGLPLSIIGARLYYVFFEFDHYKSNPLSIFAINEGGLAIHGGLFTAFIFGFFYLTKIKKLKHPFVIADIAALTIPIGQIFGRLGNFFNQEAHGPETTREFLSQVLHLPDVIVNQMYICPTPQSFCPTGVGAYYHPTFLYEMIWNIIGVALMYFVIRNLKGRLIGEMALFYFIWYSIGRALIEMLRTDALLIPNTNIPIAITIGIVIIITSIFCMWWRRKKGYEMVLYNDLKTKQ